MGANPFEELGSAVESLRTEVRTMATLMATLHIAVRDQGERLDALVAHLAEKAPEWEALADACERRHKGRDTLLKAIADGEVAAKRVTCRGGHGKWLLSIADLDKHFPVHGAGREKKKPRPQRLGFPNSDELFPAHQAPAVIDAVFR